MVKEKKKKANNHYLDGDRFTKELDEWAKDARDAISRGEDRPMMSDYIAQSILDIINNAAKMSCFRKYTWIEEMKGGGILNIMTYLHNFNPEYGSGYSYITSIGTKAFCRVSDVEKRQGYYKNRTLFNMVNDGSVENLATDSLKRFINDSGKSDFMDKTIEYEQKQAEKNKKKNTHEEGDIDSDELISEKLDVFDIEGMFLDTLK